MSDTLRPISGDVILLKAILEELQSIRKTLELQTYKKPVKWQGLSVQTVIHDESDYFYRNGKSR